MKALCIELPEDAFSALRCSPEEATLQLRLAAAIQLYRAGTVSQERAAQVAGMDRTDFLMQLAREHVEAFHVDLADLKQEIEGEAASSRSRPGAPTCASRTPPSVRGGPP